MSDLIQIFTQDEVEEKESIPREPHYLTEDALVLRNVEDDEESQRDIIPPPTPNSEYEFELPTLHSFPNSLPSIDSLDIPYVREKGVKFCIEHFGEYFGCVDYKINLLQFWFLDTVTDCLWMAQDEFQFPENLQKVVLSWVLYFIDLIRDPNKNITRREFFETFKEAILIASEIVEEGCDELPTPDKLISLIEQKDGDERSWDSCSTASNCSSIEITEDDYKTTTFVELGAENRHKYLLNESTWKYDKHELSSTDSFPESQITEPLPEVPKKKKRRLKDIDFYQPDPNMPSRFLPLSEEITCEGEPENEEEEKMNSMCTLGSDYLTENGDDRADCHVKELAENFYVKSKESVADDSKQEESKDLLKFGIKDQVDGELPQNDPSRPEVVKSKKQILGELAVQKIWEQRLLDMDNPKKGWIPTLNELEAEPPVQYLKMVNEEVGEGGEEGQEEEIPSSEESETSIDNYWIDSILTQQKELTEDSEDRQVVNYGVIRAIIEFIFKYFYESFQFMVVKLAFLGSPDTICQKLNKEWKVPKRIKEELVKPKEPKPEKKKKEPKPKKEKAPKAPKPPKPPKPPKEKKEKPPKPAKLTAEEKAEMARLKREEELLEAEMMKLEENKRFVFPLDEAGTDELFTGIFGNWKRVNFKSAEKDKGKKGKKG